MDTSVVIQQMLMLFAMMMAGYISYKKGWLSDEADSKLSTTIVHIMNPCVIINGVLGKDVADAGALIGENLILVILFFGLVIMMSAPLATILHVRKKDRSVYEMMTIFTNIGLVGLPIVISIYGQASMIFVSFYILVFNVLAYTLGIYLMNHHGAKMEWKKILNSGVVACLVALCIFAFRIKTPMVVNNFMNYMGTAVIPLSMMVVGVSIAKADLKEIFSDIHMYQFAFWKLLVIPCMAVMLAFLLPFDPMLEGIFIVMMAMPVGSIVAMMADEYGADKVLVSHGIVMTTLFCVVTVPIVSAFKDLMEMILL